MDNLLFNEVRREVNKLITEAKKDVEYYMHTFKYNKSEAIQIAEKVAFNKLLSYYEITVDTDFECIETFELFLDLQQLFSRFWNQKVYLL